MNTSSQSVKSIIEVSTLLDSEVVLRVSGFKIILSLVQTAVALLLKGSCYILLDIFHSCVLWFFRIHKNNFINIFNKLSCSSSGWSRLCPLVNIVKSIEAPWDSVCTPDDCAFCAIIHFPALVYRGVLPQNMLWLEFGSNEKKKVFQHYALSDLTLLYYSQENFE